MSIIRWMPTGGSQEFSADAIRRLSARLAMLEHVRVGLHQSFGISDDTEYARMSGGAWSAAPLSVDILVPSDNSWVVPTFSADFAHHNPSFPAGTLWLAAATGFQLNVDGAAPPGFPAMTYHTTTISHPTKDYTRGGAVAPVQDGYPFALAPIRLDAGEYELTLWVSGPSSLHADSTLYMRRRRFNGFVHA